MNRQPSLTVHEDKSTKEVIIQVDNETHRVPEYIFQRCCRELGIKSMQGILSSFRLICEWFIKEEQYTEFEETK
mgnify:CR=1 FL=1